MNDLNEEVIRYFFHLRKCAPEPRFVDEDALAARDGAREIVVSSTGPTESDCVLLSLDISLDTASKRNAVMML